MVAGIRPEDLRADQEAGPEAIEVTVSVIEPAGSVAWVEAAWQDRKVRAVSAPDAPVRSGDRMYLHISGASIALFDAETGERL